MAKEADPYFATASFQVVVEQCDPWATFSSDYTASVPPAAPQRTCVPDPSQHCCPSLELLQHLNVALVARGSELSTGFKVWPQQCQIHGYSLCPGPAATLFNTGQDATGFLGHTAGLHPSITSRADQHLQSPFCWPALKPLSPQPVVQHRVVVTPAFPLAEPCANDLGLLF